MLGILIVSLIIIVAGVLYTALAELRLRRRS